MRCPRCGTEMTMDGHRKIEMFMCYECGYIEGRNMEENVLREGETNFQRLHALNFNETVAFMVNGLGAEETKISAWLDGNFSRA